jgi:O-acetyl-ADP-ribose deacetylase (regulator of RNase III)
MKIIQKDITTVERGIIVSQVNCQGAMNSGLAKTIREKWPKVYDSYVEFIRSYKFHGNLFWTTSEMLGEINLVDVEPNIYVANLFGQDRYGYDGKRYTRYGAIETGLENLLKNIDTFDLETLPVFFPFRFGSDRGGANWEIIKLMVEEYFPNAIICKL